MYSCGHHHHAVDGLRETRRASPWGQPPYISLKICMCLHVCVCDSVSHYSPPLSLSMSSCCHYNHALDGLRKTRGASPRDQPPICLSIYVWVGVYVCQPEFLVSHDSRRFPCSAAVTTTMLSMVFGKRAGPPPVHTERPSPASASRDLPRLPERYPVDGGDSSNCTTSYSY